MRELQRNLPHKTGNSVVGNVDTRCPRDNKNNVDSKCLNKEKKSLIYNYVQLCKEMFKNVGKVLFLDFACIFSGVG